MKPIRIGREPDDVILDPDSAQVISREHCVVERDRVPDSCQ
jgi:pSer/pThr/pTyr-binding forkhead associated (FHA) protein